MEIKLNKSVGWPKGEDFASRILGYPTRRKDLEHKKLGNVIFSIFCHVFVRLLRKINAWP